MATGCIKLASGLSGTVLFLKALGSLYNSFGIGAQSIEKTQLSLQDAVHKVSYVNDNNTKTVSEVKQQNSIKETTATNGPEGTVSNKTQVSLKLLEEGMRRLYNSIASINNDYLQDIELSTLLTTAVENLHAVSHFKHETFTALQYSQDFGLITKESWKRVTKWAAKYLTHEKILLSGPSNQHGVCKCKLYATSTFSRDRPRDRKCYERICGEVSSLEAKDGSEGNYQRTGQGLYHRPFTQNNKIPPTWTCWRD